MKDPGDPPVDLLASALLSRAQSDEQVAHPIAPTDDVDAIRAEVRRLSRERGIRIRTGIVGGDTLVVILADARLWTESTAVMRSKLTPG